MRFRSSRPSHAKPALRARRGGLLVIVAASMTVMIGFGALVCDVGLALAQRTRMQMAADAAALAGARLLGPRAQAYQITEEAINVAKANGYTLQDTAVNVDPIGQTVAVKWKQPVSFLLGPVLHVFGADVGVTAVAGTVPIGKVDIVPFLVPQERINFGAIMTLKYCAEGGDIATSPSFGNFGAASIDGVGANVYYQSIVHGAQTPLTAGMFVSTEPGDMTGPTDQGVTTLIGGDSVPFEQALTTPTKRLVTVPLVAEADYAQIRGRKPIMIRGFARFYLIGSQGGAVTGQFIDRTQGANAAPEQQTRVKLIT